MGVALGFGIAGAVVVLLGTAVLSGNHWPRLRRLFNRMSPRYGAIEEGLDLLSGDLQKPRCLEEGQAGFHEILGIIAERARVERAEFSAIRYGRVGAEDSVERTHVALRSRTGSPSQWKTIVPKEVVEQWLHDARLGSLSLLGFIIVFCGVVLGLVSLVMQAIASGNC